MPLPGPMVLSTRMNSVPSVVGPPPSAAKASVTAVAGAIVEGQQAKYVIHRSSPFDTDLIVDWTAESEGAPSDLVPPVTGTVTFPANDIIQIPKNIGTNIKVGSDPVRRVSMFLSNPRGGELDPAKYVAYISMSNYTDPGSGAVLPTPLHVVDVVNSADLVSKLGASSIADGTEFQCRAGDYPGLYQSVKSSSAIDHPIVIRAAPGAVCTLSGTGRIELLGANNVAAFWECTGNYEKIRFNAQNWRVHRNKFTNINFDGIIGRQGKVSKNNISGGRTDYNIWKDITGAAQRIELGNALITQNIKFDHNHIWGHTVHANGNESANMFLTDHFQPSYLEYSDNWWQDCLKSPAGQKELVSAKTMACRFLRNSMTNCNNGFFCARETKESIFTENYMAQCFIQIFGDDNQVLRNFSTGRVCSVFAGNAYDDNITPSVCSTFSKNGQSVIIYNGHTPVNVANDCSVAHTGARRTILTGNTGDIIVGDHFSTGYTAGAFNARDTVLTNNGPVAAQRNTGWFTGITETGTGPQPQYAFPKTASDVGPLAGL